MGRRGARSIGGCRAIGAANKRGSLPECAGLALDPILSCVGLALAIANPLEFRGRTNPFCNVGVVNEGATSFGVLLPVAGAAEKGFAEQSFVAQVGGVIERLDKLDSVGVNGATPCGAAGMYSGNECEQFMLCHILGLSG